MNVFTGGTKLMTVLNTEFGSREIGSQKIHGVMTSSMMGIIIDCASRMSLTAEPTAILSEPIVKNASRKNTNR